MYYCQLGLNFGIMIQVNEINGSVVLSSWVVTNGIKVDVVLGIVRGMDIHVMGSEITPWYGANTPCYGLILCSVRALMKMCQDLKSRRL